MQGVLVTLGIEIIIAVVLALQGHLTVHRLDDDDDEAAK